MSYERSRAWGRRPQRSGCWRAWEFSALAWMLMSGTGIGQQIVTVAGGGGINDGGQATSASLAGPSGVAVDGVGNLYIADMRHDRVRKVDVSTGSISTVAGTGISGFSGNGGPATAASLSSPRAVALDGSGSLYIVDSGNQRVRKVDASTGNISTVAGDGIHRFAGDGGPASSASLANPFAVVVDGAGNLYITDRDNNRVRRVDAQTGRINTVAGKGIYGFAGDGGSATDASLANPAGIAVDETGNLYIADTDNRRVRKVDAQTGRISTVAGTGTSGFSGDGGLAIDASLANPQDVAVDEAGNLYVADKDNNRIRKVDAQTGRISTVVGNGGWGFSGDGGPATEARIAAPGAIIVGYPRGVAYLYIADQDNGRIRRVDPRTGRITTVAGGNVGEVGLATEANLVIPGGVVVDGTGNLYIADTGNSRVRRVDGQTGRISTVAGNSTDGFSGDGGPATEASLSRPWRIAMDGSGNLFIADQGNQRVRRVDAQTGRINTVAGSGAWGSSGDGGPATDARLSNPSDIAVDRAGNLYIADTWNHRVRRVDAQTGRISAVAGSGTYGFAGDGGPATNARLAYPWGIALDGTGNLYIADADNHRVRRVDAQTGRISTVAGTGSAEFTGDGGLATNASLNWPTGIAVDGVGSLYIADNHNNRIRRVGAQTGIISTVAGTGAWGFAGDGSSATDASLASPWGVAVDRAGNLYIADRDNGRVRRVALSAPPALRIAQVFIRLTTTAGGATIANKQLSVRAGDNLTFAADVIAADGRTAATAPTWTVAGGIGAITSAGAFTAGKKAGISGRVVATAGGVRDSVSVTILPATLSKITISPSTVTVTPRQNMTFTAAGVDAFGNQVPIRPLWYAVGGIGTINLKTGVFTAGTKAGSGYVIVYADSLFGDTGATLSGSAKVVVEAEVPAAYTLTQNYPNPFNPETTIPYDLPEATHVRLFVYDLVGQQIRTLVRDTQQAGHYSVVWDGRNDDGLAVAGGVYFYRLEAVDHGFVEARGMVLVR